MTVENIVTKLREEMGWTQEQMAEEFSVSRELINKMESGKMPVSSKMILKIQRYREVNIISHNQVNEPAAAYKKNAKTTHDKTLETVYSLAESNKTLVESHKTLVESNADLVGMIKSMQQPVTVEHELGIPAALISKFAGLLDIVAELGAGKVQWKSKEEGLAELSRRFYGDLQKT